MKWLESPNSDEHVLCDDRGHASEFRVRRDPVSGVYRAYDGERRILEGLAIEPCRKACEELYAAERASTATQTNKAGRYTPKERTRTGKINRGAHHR